MTNEQIKQIFLANGFTEKLQAGGHTDLNPYVYDAAKAVMDAAIEEATNELKAQGIEQLARYLGDGNKKPSELYSSSLNFAAHVAKKYATQLCKGSVNADETLF